MLDPRTNRLQAPLLKQVANDDEENGGEEGEELQL
jgi:hypothetical protein